MEYNPFSLNGKTILVTGASSGIGRAIAIECSKAGASLILNGRNEERLKETLQNLTGVNHLTVSADLSIPAGISFLADNIGPIDGLVYAAGISKRLPLKFIKEEALMELQKVNFFAPVLISQKLYKKKLINDEASLVYISSVAANYATVGSIMYMSSKGALNSFVKGLANELATGKIRANAILPGMVKTKMNKSISDEDINKDLINYPLGRYGSPEEVAYAAIFLLSDATKWMTGSLLTIDGGLTLR